MTNNFYQFIVQQIHQDHGLVKVMTNNLSHGGKQNPNRVNIHEDCAVRLWTDKFGCTKQQLEQAVKKLGAAPGAVRAELGRRVPLRPQ